MRVGEEIEERSNVRKTHRQHKEVRVCDWGAGVGERLEERKGSREVRRFDESNELKQGHMCVT